MTAHEEFIPHFLEECRQTLDQLDRDVAKLTENPHDSDRLAEIFRTVHTIKGNSSIFGFAKLGAVAHLGENLLEQLQQGELAFDSQIAIALLALADALRELLSNIEQTGEEGDSDYNLIQANLSRIGTGKRPSTNQDISASKNREHPILPIFSLFLQSAPDLAAQCGKQVEMEIEGGDIELSPSLIEAIKDPLTHCLRNAIDHGIEPPAERAAIGKPAQGKLLLRAHKHNGTVHIEIVDDGAGISVDKIKRAAIERGQLTADRAREITDQQAVRLIFQSGFSTAAQTTDVSGRGVGMDVVKTKIERIGGRVELFSEPGVGTTVRIKLPPGT